MVITMAKLRMAHASTHGTCKPPGPIVLNVQIHLKNSVKILHFLDPFSLHPNFQNQHAAVPGARDKEAIIFSFLLFWRPLGVLEKLPPKLSGLEVTRKVCGGLQPIE